MRSSLKWRLRLHTLLRRVQGDFSDVARVRLQHVVPVEQPLVLISQVNRSGGTLLAQLFSGHPECHAHPGELHIGYPKKDCWPALDLTASPATWLRQLSERRLPHYARDGFSKVPDVRRVEMEASDLYFPFLFSMRLMRQIFEQAVDEREIQTQRDVLDCYHTAYFNAWLDYQGLYAQKKYLVAFTPRLSSREASVEGFFRDYPEGRMISVIRDPKTWWVSLRGSKPDERIDAQDSLPRWKASTEAALANRKRYGDRVYLLSFERLLGDTEATMRDLAAYLGIGFHESLLRPTFQDMGIGANSSFAPAAAFRKGGVMDAPLKRAQELPSEEIARIDAEVGELYEAALKETAGA
jgi:hypothetical protein